MYTQAGCSGEITDTAPDAQAFTISTLTIQGGIYSNSLIEINSAAGTSTIDGGEWLYSTKADTLSGSIRCIRQLYGYTDAVNVTVNAPLKAGWNYLKVHAMGTYSGPGSAINETINLNFVTVDDQPSLWAPAMPITTIAQSVNPLAQRVEAELHTVRFGNIRF